MPSSVLTAIRGRVLTFLFAHLDRIGYSGSIGCEYKPATTTAEGLGWFSPYRRNGEAAA